MPGRVVGATAVSWPSCPVVSRPAWSYRSAPTRARRVLRPSAVSQCPSGRVAGPAARRWPCRGLPMAVSWLSRPAVSRYSLASYPSASVTILQSVLQPNSHPSQAQAVTIQSLYRGTRSLPTQPASLSRYTRLYRDTPSHQAFQSRYNFVL